MKKIGLAISVLVVVLTLLLSWWALSWKTFCTVRLGNGATLIASPGFFRLAPSRSDIQNIVESARPSDPFTTSYIRKVMGPVEHNYKVSLQDSMYKLFILFPDGQQGLIVENKDFAPIRNMLMQMLAGGTS